MSLKRRKQSLFIAALFTFALAVPIQTQASPFTPTFGDVSPDYPGQEQAVVLEEGGVYLYTSGAELFPNFPFFIEDEVIVTAPQLGNFIGDAYDEIAFLSKNQEGDYRLTLINHNAEIVHQRELGELTLDGNPVVFRGVEGNIDRLILARDGGMLQAFRIENDAWQHEDIAHLETTALLATNRQAQALIVTTPEEPQWHIYHYFDGDRDVPNWNHLVFDVPAPVVYPATIAQESMYMITADLRALHIGQNEEGVIDILHQTQLSKMPAGPIIVGDLIEGRRGNEVEIRFFDGSRGVYSDTLFFFEPKIPQSALARTPSFAFDYVINHIHQHIVSFTQHVMNYMQMQVSSVWSTFMQSDQETGAALSVSLNGEDIVHDQVIDLGVWQRLNERRVEVLLKNNGNKRLVFDDAQMIDVISSEYTEIETRFPNRQTLEGEEFVQIPLTLSTNRMGMHHVDVSISSDDPIHPVFQFRVTFEVDGPLVLDGDMEWIGKEHWESHDADLFYQKETSDQFAGAQSLFLQNNQQENLSVFQTLYLDPGAYHLQYRYRSTHRNEQALRLETFIFAREEEQAMPIPIFRQQREINNTDWHLFDYHFEIPEGSDTDAYALYIQMSEGEVYLDEVQVEELNNISLIQDGDMELADMQHWMTQGQAQKMQEEANQYMRLETSEEYPITTVTQRAIPVEANTRYRLRFRYQHTEEGRAFIRTRIPNVLQEGTIFFSGLLDESDSLLPATLEWTWYEREIDIPAQIAVDTLNVEIVLESPQPSLLSLDDILFERLE